MQVTKGMGNTFEESLRRTYLGHYLETQTPVASDTGISINLTAQILPAAVLYQCYSPVLFNQMTIRAVNVQSIETAEMLQL